MANPEQLFMATGVGSLPHREAKKACDFIVNNFHDSLPFWPQLVKRSFNENMYAQYSQGLPGVVVDKSSQRIYLDKEKDSFLQEMEEAYLHALNGDYEFFAIGEEYASGFYEMLSRLSKIIGLKYFKGQVIGPVSLGLSLTDQNKQAVIYQPELSEILVKVLRMKIKWQIRKIKAARPDIKAVIFIDEPYLVSLGSSFVAVKKEKIIADINALIGVIHEEGGLSGIHCCGNTDWGAVLETGLDILNFDAYNYLGNLLLYKQALDNFLSRGGMLAWGIVPTENESLNKISGGDLVKKIEAASRDANILRNNVIITPSCGCGTLEEPLAERAHLLAKEISAGLAEKKY
jgi:hypothetical protein